MNRAYSLLTLKSVDEDQRIIRGTATTPEVDRQGDIVEPEGAEFKLPIPLLWQHNSQEPIGHVIEAKVKKTGIEIVAQLAKMDEPGALKDRLDEAWQSIKSGLVRGLSIGFKELEYSRIEPGYGLRFLKWMWLELSAVTIPANASGAITAIKSISHSELAATGRDLTVEQTTPPGDTGKPHKPVSLLPKEGKKVNIKEQIVALEKKRDEHKARRLEIQELVAKEGRTKNESEQEEFKNLGVELSTVEAELRDLAELDAVNIKTATPVAGVTPVDASNSRAPSTGRIVEFGPKVEKGVGFLRLMSALAQAEGNRPEAANLAKRWADSTPQVEQILRMPKDLIAKTAVNPGTTTDTTWAAPLVQYNNLASEFIDYMRPLSIMGRINGFRRVPFKTKVPRQTAGASVNWVGEGKVKPLTSLAFDSVTLDHNKVAGIIPLTEELVRLSSPSAELLVRDDLAASIAQFIDAEFLDITNASTDVSPASITYGLTPTQASGTTAAAFRLDVKTMLATLLVANQQIANGTWVMTQQQALAFSMMQNALGQPEFPGITPMGGTLLGFPVVASENLSAAGGSPTDGYPITFILPGEVLLADDGGVTVDFSREASLQMETTPDSPFTASTVMVSLWQHNMVGIRVERYITWKTRRTTAAGVIQGAKYAE